MTVPTLPVLVGSPADTTTPAATTAGAAVAAWRSIALPLGLGLLLLGGAFNVEIAAAVRTWIQSTAYNHCFLVIPIAAFLLWERRSDISGLTPSPLPRVALLGVPLALLWLAAERLGIIEGRQLAAISFVELLFLAVLGRQVWWALAGPLLYLYFLVPFGEFLTPGLQDVTTFFIRRGLELLGVPAYVDGYIIEIPQGTFLVAEACAGLRFLIASFAFGCLYALMLYRSPMRRLVFIVVSIIVPIVANGIRGLGIVYLGHLLNSAQAAAADHIIYGWIFFSFVILVLIVLGLPFRQDGMASSPPRRQPLLPPVSTGSIFTGSMSPGPTFRRRTVGAAVGVAVVAVLGPLLSAGLAMAIARPAETATAIDPGPGCTILAGRSENPAATWVRTQRVACGGLTMDMTWEAFSPWVTAAPLMQERRRLTRRVDTEGLTEAWLPGPGDQPRPWRIMHSTDPAYVLAAAIWIDGRPARPGLSLRLRMARDSLFGTAYAPMVMIVTPAVSWGDLTPADRRAAEASVAAFLQAHPGLDARVGAMSALR